MDEVKRPTSVEAFEAMYADRYQTTRAALHMSGRRGIACGCGADHCCGFVLVHRDRTLPADHLPQMVVPWATPS